MFLNNFGDLHIWCQNWHQYVWTSLCQFIFFVNLLHSPCVWLFYFWHLFDNLTSFWQLDIFFDIWAMGNVDKWVSWLILKIQMGDLMGWGTWVMGQWATWSMWSCALSCATSLILDILTSFNLNHLSPSQGYFSHFYRLPPKDGGRLCFDMHLTVCLCVCWQGVPTFQPIGGGRVTCLPANVGEGYLPSSWWRGGYLPSSWLGWGTHFPANRGGYPSTMVGNPPILGMYPPGQGRYPLCQGRYLPSKVDTPHPPHLR